MSTKGWSFGALAAALKSIAFWEPVDMYKAIYPVGIVVMFDNQTNPNSVYPGTTWVQITHGRTIRAARNLNEISSEFGSDDITLTAANIPAHSHGWSGSVASTDLGTKTTSDVSTRHTHTASGTTSSAGAHVHAGRYRNSNPSFNGGTSNARTWDITTGGTTANDMIQSAGAHTHTVSGETSTAGSHTHTVAIGAHSHTVSGTVSSTGGGGSFNVTNTCHMYGMWKRTA